MRSWANGWTGSMRPGTGRASNVFSLSDISPLHPLIIRDASVREGSSTGQYVEVVVEAERLPTDEQELTVQFERRSVRTSIAALDSFIEGFRSSEVTLIDSSDPLLSDMVHLLTVNHVLDERREVVWVDGGNSINPYSLAGICKRLHTDSQEVLDSVSVSRAFTAYQYVTLIEEMTEEEVRRRHAGMLVLSCFPDLFLDKDMWWSESQQLMRRCLTKIQDLTKRYGLITLVTNFGLSKLLYKKSLRSMMYSSADRVLRIDNTRSSLRLTLVNEGRQTLYHPVPYYQRTLDEFAKSSERQITGRGAPKACNA